MISRAFSLEDDMRSLSSDDQVFMLRRHCMSLAGYAFTLARRLGMTPDEAVRLWMEPAMQRSSGGRVEIDTWIDRNVAAMSVFHGPVDLRRDGETWIMGIDASNVLPVLAAWDAVDYWVAWITEQGRMVAQPQGLDASSRLDSSILTFRFEPRPDGV
jgi:hypothetical protein